MIIFLKLQVLFLSFLIRNIGADYYSGLAKFYTFNKIWNNIKLDSIDGDYIEFGMLNGKTLLHSYKVSKKLNLHKNIKFWGLDSFEGFPVENHNFYKNENFKSSYKKVLKTFNKYSEINIVKGFFSESLQTPLLDNLRKLSFVYIDCDIYESSLDIIPFIKDRTLPGSFIMIDDYSSIDHNGKSIAKAFLENFKIDEEVIIFDYFDNGVVFRMI
jgi:O-methyltransferase|tara:strand:+ start:1087 stop:1728 length:642 start_codon:yes stop_codon:yes gene_type:complete